MNKKVLITGLNRFILWANYFMILICYVLLIVLDEICALHKNVREIGRFYCFSQRWHTFWVVNVCTIHYFGNVKNKKFSIKFFEVSTKAEGIYDQVSMNR